MKGLHWGIAAVALGWSLHGCAGGSGTETTSGSKVFGRVVHADGSAAKGAGLAVRSSGYLHDSSHADDTVFRADAFADLQGSFTLDSLAPGPYLLEVRDASGNASMAEFTKASGAMELEPITLRKPGSLQGRLGRVAGTSDQGYVQVYGLQRVVRADSGGGYRITNLPSGRLRIRAVSSRTNWGYRDSLDATVAAGDSTLLLPLIPISGPDEAYPTWIHSRALAVNTATPAILGDVRDFPLLIRLTSANFDFRQSNGNDLRFAKSDGTHLPYAVEKWDSAAGAASIWVRVDTIHGNRSNQAFTMHWGKAGAGDRSDSRSVFSSYSGVWQLTDSVASDGAGRFRDASPSAADGNGSVVAGDKQGVVADGRPFQGLQGIRIPGVAALKPADAVSLSAWFRATGTDSLGGEIASMGDNYGLRLRVDGTILFRVKTNRVPDTMSLDVAGEDLRDNLWHHVTGTYDGVDLRIFLDGYEKTSTGKGNGLAYDPGRDFWIGKHGNGSQGYGFFGQLDLVQVAPTCLPPDWIALGFENQKPNSALVEFK